MSIKQQHLLIDMQKLLSSLTDVKTGIPAKLTLLIDGMEVDTTLDAFRNITNMLTGRTWSNYNDPRFETMYALFVGERYRKRDKEWEQRSHSYQVDPKTNSISLTVHHYNLITKDDHFENIYKVHTRGEYLGLVALLLTMDHKYGIITENIHRGFTLDVQLSSYVQTEITFTGEKK